MVTKVESTTAYANPYAHLFSAPDVEKNKNREIDAILIDVCNTSSEIHESRRYAYYKSKTISQNAQLDKVHEKTATLLKPWSTGLQGFSVIFQVAAAFFGGATNVTGGILSASGQGFNVSANHLDQVKNAESSAIDFHKSRFQETGGELAERMRTTDQESRRDLDKINEIIALERKKSEMFGTTS